MDSNTTATDFEWIQKKLQEHEYDCPHCGKCKHCGRGGQPTYIPYPVYPQPQYPQYPYLPREPWYTSDTTTQLSFTSEQ